MLYVNFIISLSCCIVIILGGFIQDRLFDGIVMHIDRCEAECRGKNVISQGFFRGIKALSGTIIFVENYTLVVNNRGPNKLMVTITINRCRSKENLDTCEEFLKQRNIDFCKALDANYYMDGLNPLAFPFNPKVRCPFEKGVYHAYNFSYDLAPFIFFKIEGWYWRILMEIFGPDQNNKLVYCTHMEGYVTNSKSKTN